MRFYFFLCIVLIAVSCGGANNSNINSKANGNTAKTPDVVPVSTYEIVKTYPHDPTAFTQGLVLHDGVFYEGTGGSKTRGDDFYSSLRKVDVETGKVLKKFDLAPDLFGEGITIFNDKVYQLTWRDHVAYQYDLNDFKLIKEFRYSGEGWGLTEDGTNLYMSDGTHVIRVLDPETFETIRTIAVQDEKGRPLMKLNELEWVKGEIWANVWETGWIVRIDPKTGKLLGRIDLNTLADKEMDADVRADVLNGIAYDAATDRIFVTGKKWKHLFEIKVNQP